MATTYLSKTFASPGNRRTYTLSFWIKRANLGAYGIFQGWDTAYQSGFASMIYFNSSNQLEFDNDIAGADYTFNTDMVFRDTSSWYHIVIAIDTTQATETDRQKIYVNGSQVSLTETDLGFPTQNFETYINKGLTTIGGYSYAATNTYDGSMAHVHFIDGTAYAASDFGETDATSGIWKPKIAPSVTYGTNGFFLKFANSGSLGTDSSGNANNFSIGAGTGTQTLDTPSNVFATVNSLNIPSADAPTFQYGNTESTTPGTTGRFGGTSTLGMSAGKYYWESKYLITGLPRGGFGITYDPAEQARNNATASNYPDCWEYQSEAGYIRNNSTVLDTEATYANGDVVMCALDLDNNYVYFGKNGTWVNSGDPTSGSSGTGGYAITSGKTYFTITSDNTSGSDQQTYQFNFGNGYFGTSAISTPYNDGDGFGKFQYQPPTGYYALCTKNINTYG